MNVSAISVTCHAHGCVMRSCFDHLVTQALTNPTLRQHLDNFEQYDQQHGVQAYGQRLLVPGETAQQLAQFLAAQGNGYHNLMIGSGLL